MPTSVLLCDTPDEVARFQYHLLREHDLEVEVTTDAFRGVEAAVRSRPDVIVSELALEGLGGAELVKRFLASSPASRFVAYTVVRDPVRVTEVLAAGASGYVLKEDPIEDSLRAIRGASSGAVSLSGQVAGLLSSELARAVNRSRELEGELAALRDDVAQGSTAKADFLANISHELRTPVTVAKGIAYVLKNPAVPEAERTEFLDQLTGSLDKLMGIVDEIITLSELERGTFELNLTESDLAPLVRHALDEVRMRYPGTPIAAEVPDGLVCVSDGPRIGSVVRELLDNACRYSPFGRTVELVARDLAEGVTAVGMSATWVDATRVGVPSDYYYVAANGPLLSRLSTGANCREVATRAYLNRRPILDPGRWSPGHFMATGEGICRRGTRGTLYAYFVAAPGFGRVHELGIPRSGLYVVVAVVQRADGARALLKHLIHRTRFGETRIGEFVDVACDARRELNEDCARRTVA